MNLIPVQYRLAAKLLARLAGLAAVVFALWWAYTAIWGRGAAHVQAKWDQAVVAAERAAKRERDRRAAEMAAIDQRHLKQLQEKTDEIERLRSDVAAGRSRLRVAARCPVQAPAGPGVGAGAAAEPGAAAGSTGDAYLDPAAEPAYFALKAGLVKQREQLLACQALLQ